MCCLQHFLSLSFLQSNARNTCYLNSSVQCLSHTPILRDFFTSKAYLHDINTTNPLGFQGHLAQAFAVLVHSLWKPSNQPRKINPSATASTPLDAPALTPKTFKEAIGKFNESFVGNEQHDAQEFLTFILGGLQEDLNRIMEKPYIEAPDSDGRPDKELADIWWANHFKRELSVIDALFTGQYKSSLVCKTCKYESCRYETFTTLTLPLPEDDQISIQCVLYPIQGGKEIMKYSVRVRHDGTVNDVLKNLAKILYTDSNEAGDEGAQSKAEAQTENDTPADSNESFDENDSSSNELYSEMAQGMAMVDMGESTIRKIIPVSFVMAASFVHSAHNFANSVSFLLEPAFLGIIKACNSRFG